jgi:hypothetical protein
MQPESAARLEGSGRDEASWDERVIGPDDLMLP